MIIKEQIIYNNLPYQALLLTKRGLIAALMTIALGMILFYPGAVSITNADLSIGNVPTGKQPRAAAVNPITNKIYVANQNNSNVTVIDGTNNSTTTVAAGTRPRAVEVNPVTNRIYVANSNSANVTGITPANTSPISLNTTVAQFPNNTASNPTPNFNFTATSAYSPNAPKPTNIYFQIDTQIGEWTKATNTGSTATTLTAAATSTLLQPGIHIVYFYATDGADATSMNPRPQSDAPFDMSEIFNGRFDGQGKELFKQQSPKTSPIIGGINAMVFLVPLGPTAAPATVSGKITSNTGRGIGRVYVTLTNQNGETMMAATNPFGYFTFAEVTSGKTYIISARHKNYRFAPSLQVINVVENLTDVQFTSY